MCIFTNNVYFHNFGMVAKITKDYYTAPCVKITLTEKVRIELNSSKII